MTKFSNAFTLSVVLLGAFSFCNAGIADQLLGSIERLLGDRAFVTRQLPCVLEKGSCDVLGTFAKGMLREYYDNNCGNCGPEIKASLARIMATLKRDYPNEANALVAHWSRPPGRRNK